MHKCCHWKLQQGVKAVRGANVEADSLTWAQTDKWVVRACRTLLATAYSSVPLLLSHPSANSASSMTAASSCLSFFDRAASLSTGVGERRHNVWTAAAAALQQDYCSRKNDMPVHCTHLTF